MSTVMINGKKMNISGNNVCIQNNKVYVDGKLVTDEESKEPVKLIVEGDVFNIMSDGDVEITGSANGYVKAGGYVNCSDVMGDLKAGGSVHSGDVGGNVSAGGSVHCGDVWGEVDAVGNVRRK